jgi:hypothetical protein
MITLTQDSYKNFQLAWNGQPLRDGVRMQAGPARGAITVHGKTPGAVGGGGREMSQALFDAKKQAEAMLKKAIVTGEPCPDIQPVLEAAGWEVYPA